MSIYTKLKNIQQQLRAPKGQFNKFGNYNYRSCEDILEALKPLLDQEGCALIIHDDVSEVGGRVYVKATATIADDEACVDVTAFAREPLSRKGMDEAQVTGATSSYARKYALNGLFCIDDTKDADTMDNRKPAPKPATKEKPDNYHKTFIGKVVGFEEKANELLRKA